MADIRIAFTGQGRDLNDFIFDLFDTDALGEGTSKEIPGGGTMAVLPITIEKAAEVSRVIEIVLSIGRDVAVGVVASYIYEKLKAHRARHRHISMRINRREVHFDKSQITKVIEEESDIQQDDE